MTQTEQSTDAQRLSAWRSVIKAYQACDRQFAKLLAECGLTITQFDALSAICALGKDAKLSDVAARLLVTKGNVTGLVQRLQEHELVEVFSAPMDRRIIYCELTAEGKRRLSKAQQAAKRFVEVQLLPFTDGECAVVHDVMQRMYSHLEAMNPAELAKTTNQTAKRRK